MQCSSCGTQLPGGAAFCPTCGAITPSRVSESGISPNDPTSASPSYSAPEPIPASNYGSAPYGLIEQNPYEQYPYNMPNPYEISLPPPPPPPSPRRQIKTGLLIGVGVMVALLILTSIGVFALLPKGAKNNSLANASPSTAPPGAATAIRTTTSEKIPYSPYHGTSVISDPLHDNSKGYGWEEIPFNSSGGSCQFIGNAYVATAPKNSYRPCHSTTLQGSNFTFEVRMQIITGDCGGISLRDTTAKAYAYYFMVCQDETYAFYRYDGFTAPVQTLRSDSSTAIISGLKQSNLVAIVANGSNFDLYVNHQKIDSVSDRTYSQGQFGVSANANTTAAYTSARMWTL
jgi:eukaryotic-like serine/threonine-protein kinase